MRTMLFVAAAAMLMGGCSGDKSPPSQDRTISEEVLKRNCADPKWKEENLGLWYSVCRPPVPW